MANQPEMQQLNRTLQEINQSFKKMTKSMAVMNENLAEIGKRLTPPEVIFEENKMLFALEAKGLIREQVPK